MGYVGCEGRQARLTPKITLFQNKRSYVCVYERWRKERPWPWVHICFFPYERPPSESLHRDLDGKWKGFKSEVFLVIDADHLPSETMVLNGGKLIFLINLVTWDIFLKEMESDIENFFIAMSALRLRMEALEAFKFSETILCVISMEPLSAARLHSKPRKLLKATIGSRLDGGLTVHVPIHTAA